VEWANRLATEDRTLRTARLLFRSGGKGQNCINPWVQGRDAFEMGSHDFNGRDLSLRNQMSKVARVEIAKVLCHAVGLS
jgi:hypothetical protein